MKTVSALGVLSAPFVLAHSGWAQCLPERVSSPAQWNTASFGSDVAVGGDVAVVADRDDHAFCPIFTCSSGAVHVFRRTGEVWDLEATLYHSRISERDVFGGAVAMDGTDRFAASAPGEDIAGGDTGAIYMFEHNGEAWHETAEILPVEPVWSRGFGGTLALQGDTLVAGQRDDACWVYRERSGRWEFDQKIPAPPSPSFTWYSDGLALDGDWLAVGAPHDSTFALRGGMVHLYRRDGGGQFELVQTLLPPEPEKAQQGFGTAVAIEGNVLIIGAPFLDSRAGAVFTYELSDGEWVLREQLHPPTARDFGVAVTLRGDTMIATSHETLEGTAGVAYLFRRRADGTWGQVDRLLPTERPSGGFGDALATDGTTILVGAPNEAIGGRRSPGAAYLYDLSCLLCRADLDGDGELTFFDFLAFQNLFAAGDPLADFDGDGDLTFFDFLAFQNEFTAGCV